MPTLTKGIDLVRDPRFPMQGSPLRQDLARGHGVSWQLSSEALPLLVATVAHRLGSPERAVRTSVDADVCRVHTSRAGTGILPGR
jgi:hypothetical protein